MCGSNGEQSKSKMQLTYHDRGTSGTQLDVVSGDVRIATLWKAMSSASASSDIESWQWTFTLSAGPPGFVVHGTAGSKEEAQVALEKTWQQWVDAAGLREK